MCLHVILFIADHFIRDCSTTDSDSTACFSHQKGEHVSGACKITITSEEDCSENIPMACTSVVSECVSLCVLLFSCVCVSVRACVCACMHACA